MNISPYIAMGILGLGVSLPLISSLSGFGINSSPKLGQNSSRNCSISQRDSSGRCPYTQRSNFRYLSTGSSGGRSGTAGGGGK